MLFPMPLAAAAAAMTADTVLKIANPLLPMFRRNFRRRVFMAVGAGILLEVGPIGMTGTATCPVDTVEPEVPFMIESCRLPAIRIVATSATGTGSPVQFIGRTVGAVAAHALLA